MLRIEKKLKNGQISILIRDKEVFFNKTFLVALGIAFAFHALFLVIFQIAPFKVAFDNTVFPPISVQSCIDLKNVSLVVTDDAKPQTFHGIPFPAPLVPKLDTSPQYIQVKSFEVNLARSSFDEFELSLYLPRMSVPKKSSMQAIDVVVSGPLAEIEHQPFQIVFNDGKIINYKSKTNREKPLMVTSLNTEMSFKSFESLLSQSKLKEARVSYLVRVLGESGKVFWFETKEETSLLMLNKLAEDMLRQLSFALNSEILEIQGEIEIHFHQEVL